MTLVDFIGFIVALVAMFFMFMKKLAEEKRRRSLPDEKGQTLEEFLMMEEEEEETPVYPQNLKQVHSYIQSEKRLNVQSGQAQKKHEVKKVLKNESFKSLDVKSAGAYEIIERKTTSRGHSLVKKMRNPSEMFVLKEIMDKPLSMRNQNERQ